MSAHAKRIVIAILSALLLAAASVSTYRLIGELRALQGLQLERAELAHVKYGLLNAEVWVDQVSLILAERIEHFELTEENRPQLKRNVEIVLDRLLLEIEQVLRRRNAEGANWVDRLQGSLRQGVQDWLVDFDSLRARVPLYADAVLEELDRPQTREQIKLGLLQAIDEAAGATFSRVDDSSLLRIQLEHACSPAESCTRLLEREAMTRQQGARDHALWALGCIVLLFALNALRLGGSLNTPHQTSTSGGPTRHGSSTSESPPRRPGFSKPAHPSPSMI